MPRRAWEVDAAMSLNLFDGTWTAHDSYARELQRLRWFHRVGDPDYTLRSDEDVSRRLLRDPLVRHAFQVRRQLVAGRSHYMEPASDDPRDVAAAAVMEELWRSMERPATALFNLTSAILDGASWGVSVGEWKRVRLRAQERAPRGRGVELRWWCPRDIKPVDKRRFMLRRRLDSATVNQQAPLEWHWWSTQSNGGAGAWVPLGERRPWFVHVVYDDTEDTIGYGRGLREALMSHVQARVDLRIFGLQSAEKWADGWVTVAVDGLRDASTGRPNDEVVKQYASVIERHRARHVLVHDARDEIKIIEPSGQGPRFIMDLYRMHGEEIVLLVLGSDVSTLSSGSYAMAVEKNATMEGMLAFDRQLLEDAVTHDFVRALLWRINQPALQAIGLHQARPPRLRVKVERAEDPQKVAQTLLTLVQAGFKPALSDVAERVGFPLPEEGEPVLEPQRREDPEGAGDLAALFGAARADAHPDRDEKGRFAPKGTGDRTGGPKADEKKPSERKAEAAEPKKRGGRRSKRAKRAAAPAGGQKETAPKAEKKGGGGKLKPEPNNPEKYDQSLPYAVRKRLAARDVTVELLRRLRASNEFEKRRQILARTRIKATSQAVKSAYNALSKDASAEAYKAALKKDKPHIPPELHDRLYEIGVPYGDLPPKGAQDIQWDLDGPDVHRRAVGTYKNSKGNLTRVYTRKFQEDSAREKFARVEALEKRYDEFVEGFRENMRTLKVGDTRHVTSTALAVIAETGLRIGDSSKVTYGVSSLLREHVRFRDDGTVRIRFLGKSSEFNEAVVRDPDTVKALRAYAEGKRRDEPLFPRAPATIAKHARKMMGEFHPKDFRTLLATRLARAEMHKVEVPPADTWKTELEREAWKEAVGLEVSDRVRIALNNKKQTAKKNYVDPRVWETWAQEVERRWEGERKRKRPSNEA